MSHLPLTGGCNCGAVRFEVTAPLLRASYCHCNRCQRRSRTAASANAHPKDGTFRLVLGEDWLRVWKPADGGEKWFCGGCGSSLFGRELANAFGGAHWGGTALGLRVDRREPMRWARAPAPGQARRAQSTTRRSIALAAPNAARG